jgi:ATP-dependent DNA helicase DinG
LPPIITRITGIKDEDLADKQPFSAHAEDVLQIIYEADSVVAHNLSYDYEMVCIELARLDKKARWPMTRICTVEQSEWYKGYRLNLGALHEHLFGCKFEDAHRARSDVEALAKCFNEMRQRGDI